MKLSFSFGLLASLAVASFSQGAVIQAYDNTSAIAGGAGGNLNIGRQFSVTGSGITVEQLGVFDFASDGLVNAHDVTLFSILSGAGSGGASVSPLISVNVPSGTAAALSGGFRFASIAPTYLAPGNYSVVAYATNASGGDPYGDFGGTPSGANNVTHIGFDPFEFTGAASPAYPNAGDGGNHSSASFRYEVGNVPEPASLVLFGLGAVSLVVVARRNRRRVSR